MSFKYLSYIIFCSILWLPASTSAQNIGTQNLQQLKISQLSDQQLLQIWQRFQSSGMSEADAMKVLISRGLPATEIEAFKKRIAAIQSGGGNFAGKTVGTGKKDSINYTRDSVKVSNPQSEKKKSPIYGYDFFSNSSLKFEPDIRIATPKSYILGPDDELNIILTGLNETTVKAKVSPDGNIQIPYAGLVSVNGMSIEQAQSAIKQKMQKVYPALSGGQTRLSITLGNIRSIRVTIIGEIVKPGTYTLSSLSSLFNALYLSGGPTERGSLRNIEVIRNNKVIRKVDFYSFLQKGIINGNIRLEDQDVLRIPVYTKRVAIDGEIKRPGLYELKDSETLEELITYAGGFSDLAYKGLARVVQIGEKERTVRDVPSGLFDRYVPHNADSVYFEPILNRFANRVVLQGAVYRPGTFELTENLSLTELIRKADGIREDAFLSRGYIKRTRPDMQKEMLSFDVNKILAGTSADILLIKEDSVTILSNTTLRNEQSISIDGFVKAPGVFIYREGMRVADVLAMSGGFTTGAATHRVEISRLLRNEADTVANQLVKTFSLSVDSALNSPSGEFPLQPSDYVHVPRLVNYNTLGNVSVSGEVLFPGDYAIQRRDETILELIQRAGGLTPYGSILNTRIYRNGIRVDASLLGKRAKDNPVAIMEGDSIFVPREDQFVEVRGAVNTPQLLSFKTRNFKYYVNAAGGVKDNGNLKGAYVEYANGINRPVSRFLFFKNYPAVEAGSKIIVPERSELFRVKLGFGEISAITSALTALVSLIAVLAR